MIKLLQQLLLRNSLQRSREMLKLTETALNNEAGSATSQQK